MGALLSKKKPCAATAAAAVAAIDEPFKLALTFAADGTVKVALLPASQAPPPAPQRPTPCPSVPEEDLLVRVQLQESFSPNQAVHLVLVHTDKLAQGSELGHSVRDWMGTPKAQEREGELAAAEAAAEAARPRSPIGGLKSKLSPRHRPHPPMAKAAVQQ